MPFSISVAQKKEIGTPHLKLHATLLKTAYNETFNHAYLPKWTN
jgi:hypothetical protein